MNKAIAYLCIGLLLGIIGQRWLASGSEADTAAPPPNHGAAPVAAGSGASTPLERRVAALESVLELAAESREELARQLAELAAQFGDDGAAASGDGGEPSATAAQRRAQFEARARRNAPELRVQRLAEAGLEASLAERMVRRESELRVEGLQRRYARVAEQLAAGESDAVFGRRTESDSAVALRQEFGDDQYDRYLYASGQSNRTRVFDVIPGTVAERAGMQAGDVLLSYDGQRIFEMSDLIRAQHAGSQGEDVLVEVIREGQAVQLYVPRGPLGVQAARRARIAPEGM